MMIYSRKIINKTSELTTAAASINHWLVTPMFTPSHKSLCLGGLFSAAAAIRQKVKMPHFASCDESQQLETDHHLWLAAWQVAIMTY